MEMTCQRKYEAAEATAYFQSHTRPDRLRFQDRQKFGVYDLLAAPPEFASVTAFQARQDIHIGVRFRESFPGMVDLRAKL